MRPGTTITLIAGSLLGGVACLAVVAGSIREQRQTRIEAQRRLDRGIDLFHQKAYSQAEAELELLAGANAGNWKAPFYAGITQIEQKRYDRAIEFLERAISLNPNEPKILNAIAVAYFKLGRVDLAQGYFWASLDLDPTNENTKGLAETMAKVRRRSEHAAGVEQG